MQDSYKQYLTPEAIKEANRLNVIFETLQAKENIFGLASKRIMIENIETYEPPMKLNTIDDFSVLMSSNPGVYVIATSSYFGMAIVKGEAHIQPVRFEKVTTERFRPLFERLSLN